MTWAKLAEEFGDHEKVAALSNAAFRLHVLGICFSNRMLTDGRISRANLPKIGGNLKTAAECVGRGVWDIGDDGWVIHDFLEYNPSREQVIAERERRAAAGKKGADNRWHGKSKARAMAGAMANGQQNEWQNDAPSPYPSPDLRPRSGDPPNPPLARGAERAARARNGSRRKRDVDALDAEPKDYVGSYERMRAKVGR